MIFDHIDYLQLIDSRRNWYGKGSNLGKANGGEIHALLSIDLEPLVCDLAGVPGKQLRMKQSVSDPSSEDVVLMNTPSNLTLPYPPPSELVSVASFIEKHVTAL